MQLKESKENKFVVVQIASLVFFLKDNVYRSSGKKRKVYNKIGSKDKSHHADCNFA